MPSKDVLKEAIRAFDGTAIIVSHDREFLDGLVSTVYEFGGGQVREHIGGIYDFLRSRGDAWDVRGGMISESCAKQPENKPAQAQPAAPQPKNNYAEHKEQQRRISKTEKAVKASEQKIEQMEKRLKELDELLMVPENAADMTLVTEYTSTKKALDEEVERWEQLSEELESLTQ